MITDRKIKVFKTLHFIIAVVLMAGLTLSVESCIESTNQDENPDNENEKVQIVPDNSNNPGSSNKPNRTSAQQLLAIAVDKTFDKNVNAQPLTKSFVSEKNLFRIDAEAYDPAPVHISYPYDYIKIYDVVKFSCAGVKSPIVQANCGDGELEVYLASFALFKETDEEKPSQNQEFKYVTVPGIDISALTDMMFGEPMIVFKSDLGIYSCIATGGGAMEQTGNAYSGYYATFSSHKYLSDKALEKDVTEPVYPFKVRIRSNGVTLEIPDIRDSEISLDNQQTVSSEELFNLVELSNIPEESLQCEVTKLAENYFIVKTNETSNLEQVYFDEYTEFFIGDISATSDNIAVGDVITVTYGKLYESYNPKSVIANKILARR
jgi:hypothetical protein